LELKGVGVFENEVIEFKNKPKPEEEKAEIHIFTGNNGTGKSTILYALAGVIEKNSIIKRFRNTSSSISTSFDKPLPREVVLTYVSRHRNFDYQPDLEEIRDDYRCYYSSSPKAIINAKFDFAFFGYSGYRSISSTKIQAITELTDNPLSGTLNFEKSPDSKLLLQWIANTKAKSAFAFQEHKKELAEKYKSTIKKIEEAIEEITGYKVEFIFQYEPLNVGLKINDEELEFDVLPDGVKSIISWIADLLMRLERLKWKGNTEILDRNFILLLDEIEVHLHPAWQRKILPVIQKLFKNAQIFIATHSPFVVGSIDNAWIYKLELENGGARVKEIVEAKHGRSYPYIVDEIFEINKYFDVETECDLKKFYGFRDEILVGNRKNYQDFLEISRLLARKSLEVKDIIGLELKQLERITGEEIIL